MNKIIINNVQYILVYVDDFLLINNNINEMNSVKSSLSKYIEMKNMGEKKFFLGINIEVEFESQIIKLGQPNFIDRLLNKFNVLEYKVKFPRIEHNLKLKLRKTAPIVSLLVV